MVIKFFFHKNELNKSDNFLKGYKIKIRTLASLNSNKDFFRKTPTVGIPPIVPCNTSGKLDSILQPTNQLDKDLSNS